MSCRQRRLPALGLALVTGLAAAAHAATAHPPLRPVPDVTVVYQVTNSSVPDQAHKLRISYADHATRVRVDAFASPLAREPSGSVIFDGFAGEVITLVPDRHGYLTRGLGHLANPGLLLSPAMGFRKVGTRKLAAGRCTEWAITSGKLHGSACVSKDGVVLQAVRTGPHPDRLEAVSVRVSKVPGTTFDVPADYTRIDRFGHKLP